jgi:hypothetical protein
LQRRTSAESGAATIRRCEDAQDPARRPEDHVPDAWELANSSQAGTAEDRGIIKPGGRTCHVSVTNAAIDFMRAARAPT